MTVKITPRHQGYLLESEVTLPYAIEDVFGFFAEARNLEAITPPFLHFEVRTPPPIEMQTGRLIEYRLRLHGIPVRWQSEISAWEPPYRFVDEQRRGPYRRWIHEHRFESCDEGTRVIDRVRYDVPGGVAIHNRFVGPDLQRIFEYRARRMESLFTPQGEGNKRFRIAVSGASGLVGSELCARLSAQGHEVIRLVRTSHGALPGAVAWDPAGGSIDSAALEGLDAVIHLAGENIAEGRWTRVKMNRIRESRVRGTRMLAEALAGLKQPPRAFLCASAIGFYGNRGDDVLNESDAAGSGFLPEVCEAWEGAADPAREAGIRVAHLRLGVVLSRAGGALAKMLPPFQLGLGGRLGSGQQWMSWITLEDAARAIEFVLNHEGIEGPVNLTAPEPVTNLQFTKALGRVLHRPTIAPVPALGARLALGQMADDLLLASTRVVPAALEQNGFYWNHPSIRGALDDIIRARQPVEIEQIRKTKRFHNEATDRKPTVIAMK